MEETRLSSEQDFLQADRIEVRNIWLVNLPIFIIGLGKQASKQTIIVIIVFVLVGRLDEKVSEIFRKRLEASEKMNMKSLPVPAPTSIWAYRNFRKEHKTVK